MLSRQNQLDDELEMNHPLSEDLPAFRSEYRALLRNLHDAAEKRIGASLVRRCQGRTTCWDLMKKLRQPSQGVAIDAETLINHFSNIFYDRNEPLDFRPAALGIFPSDNFEVVPFSDDELVAALKALNAQAATGPQRVGSRYIRSVFSDGRTRVVLLALMNMCFVGGVVPTRWGESEVFILYKGKGEVTDPINYRGINLNDDFLRIYERLLDARMLVWLRERRPWGSEQFGFTEGVGTEDAYLCLETLAGICTTIHRVPLYANFIDLQRAFPSMLRSRALQILHEAGLPYELTRAFASTFSGNSCCLKINNKLTRVFFVNRGTKEGGINSPRIFNTVYAQVLKRLEISQFPANPRDFDPRRVYYLIFADDLVLISGDLKELERMTNELDRELGDVGMKVNAGKCKWMAYLPRIFDSHTLSLPLDLAIRNHGSIIENVEEFKYLGFVTTFDLSHAKHQKARTVLMSLAARFTGKLMKSLEITNFRSLKAYFYALVGSQLYSLSVNTFPEIEYDRAVKQFLESAFTLPSSFPMSIAKIFVGVEELMMQAFNARTNLIRRLLTGRNTDASLAAMILDRELLFTEGRGWNADFVNQFSDLIDLREYDLTSLSDVEEARRQLARALAHRRHVNFARSGFPFMIDLFPSLVIPSSFTDYVVDLPHESVRIILIFCANLMKWTYFRSTTTTCPFCREELDSPHLFRCPRISPSPLCDWSAFVFEFQSEDFSEALERLFLVLQRWSIITNRLHPTLTAHLNEFFECTRSPPRSPGSSRTWSSAN
jgi:hypothetical protein